MGKPAYPMPTRLDYLIGVWALFCKEQRIREVHAMERIGFVRSDAEDYIMEVAA